MAASTSGPPAAGLTPPGSTPGLPPEPFHGLPSLLKPPPHGYDNWWDFHEGMKGWFEANGTRSAAQDLTEKNRQTLRSLSLALKTARANLKSEDAAIAARGHREVIAISAYLNGLLDGKRVSTVYPGLLSLALSSKQEGTLDDTLAKLEKSLDDAATATRTGAGWVAAAYLAGAGLAAHGLGFAAGALAHAVE